MKNFIYLGLAFILPLNLSLAASFSPKQLSQFDGEYVIDRDSNKLEFKAFSDDERLASFKVNSDYSLYDYFETDDSYSAQLTSYTTKTNRIWTLSRDFFPFLKAAGLAEYDKASFEFTSRFPLGKMITTNISGMDPNIEVVNYSTNILSLPSLPISNVFKCSVVVETGRKSAEFKEIKDQISINVTETLDIKFVDSVGNLSQSCLTTVVNEFKLGIKNGLIENELSLYSPIHDAIIGVILTNAPSILGGYESGEVTQRLDARRIPSITHFQISRTLKWNKI